MSDFKYIDIQPVGNGLGEVEPLNLAEFGISLLEEVEEPHQLLSYGGKIIASPGNISVIQAKWKSGKSFLGSIYAAAYISGECCGVESERVRVEGRCVYIDTEQAKPHVYKLARRVHKLAGLDPMEDSSMFKVYAISSLKHEQRRQFLKQITEDPDNELIILDGARDLILDYNNPTESTLLVEEIKESAKKHGSHIVCMIHENKGSEDSKGHFGSELNGKAETVTSIKKNIDGTFEVDAKMTRNPPFDSFAFQVDEKGLPYAVSAPVNPAKVAKDKNIFKTILGGTTSKDAATLTREYSEYTATTERTARRHISDALENGTIKKTRHGFYILNATQ